MKYNDVSNESLGRKAEAPYSLSISLPKHPTILNPEE
jgi:hypothetical protein